LGLIHGKRSRHTFQTKAEAQTYAEQARISRQNQGAAAFAMSDSLRVDATKAHAILAPYNVTLAEAAQYYEKHVLVYRNAPLIKEIADRYIADATAKDRRDRTIGELKARFKAFADDFPDSRLNDLTSEDIADWIDEADWSGRTKVNYLTKISQLFNYAIKHHWADTNPVEQVDRPPLEDKEPKIFTVDQAKALLQNSNRFGLLPYAHSDDFGHSIRNCRTLIR
jgi:integrase